MANQKQAERMTSGRGFIAALDQSGGSTPKALRLYGIEEAAYSSDAEMFDLIHQMRSRIITSSVFGGDRVLAAILFEQTMDRDIEGTPVGDLPLGAQGRRAVPQDRQGAGGRRRRRAADEADPADSTTLLERAVGKGIFGTKERSVIGAADCDGHRRDRRPAVRAGAAGAVARAGPHPRARGDHHDPGQGRRPRASCSTRSARSSTTCPSGAARDAQAVVCRRGQRLPPLIEHPKVMRVVALSGGYSRDEADELLAKNTGPDREFQPRADRGIDPPSSPIEEFDATLDTAIQSIYDASVAG